jgi:predicted porin
MNGKWPGRPLGGFVATLLLLSLPASAAAQSRELVSLQLSGELVFPTQDYGGLEKGTTLGWEGQVRFTFSRFSVGVGYENSRVFESNTPASDITANLSVGFVEPRYVLGVFGNIAAPYLAARIGYGSLLVRASDTSVNSSDGSFIIGGGGGVIFQVAKRVGIDLGAQYFVADFANSSGSAGYFLLRLGVSVGLF